MDLCRKCHENPIPASSGPGRPRKFCDGCSPRKVPKSSIPPSKVSRLRPAADEAAPGLAAATERDLRAAGTFASPAGVLVLTLARELEAGGHTATGLASLSREFARALAAALPVEERAAADDGVAWDVG